MSRPGGTGSAQAITDEVAALCVGLKDAAIAQAQATGWNGIPAQWTPQSFCSQVVAGTNFFVKVRIDDTPTGYMHLRIFRPLPHVGAPASVTGVQIGMGEADPCAYF